MRFSGWLGSVRSLFENRLQSRFCRRRKELNREQATFRQVETLEQRRVLTLDFVSAYVEDSTPFYVTNVTDDAELVESPQQVTLRFTPGVEIDSSQTSLDGISVFRSGGADDSFAPFGSLSDQQILPGEIVVDDFPNENQVVIRFADKLVDDTYRISISSDLQSINGESFRGGESFSFDFRLSLGQQITSVVPQPIVRASDVTVGLTQSRNVIEVYFDANEELDADSAQTAGHYKLISIDEATGADIGTPGDETVPDSVVYDSESHKATLTFLPGDIADGVLYRLEVGGAGIIASADPVVEQVIGHDSFAGAQNLGLLDQSGLLVTGSINPRVEIEAPGTLPTLFYPTPVGSVDESGHRHIPVDDVTHGLPEVSAALVTNGIISDIEYNFRSDYGSDVQGNQLFNAITGEQQVRVREIFDLFSRYAGVRFVETAASGITVATGDTRAISDNSPTTSVSGLARGGVDNGVVSADALAIVNSIQNWGESEYGGGFFNEAMRQIGQVLGLWQSYDLPSVMGESLPGENVFPSDYDILHLQQLYPRAGTEIDVYSFTLATSGHFQAETIAERLATGASTLDSVISVYDANGDLVSRNDDSFGRDSHVSLELDCWQLLCRCLEYR